MHSFDPRNATLEPEYYGDVDAAKYAERKPLIWFWMMYDRSPAGLNHWLGYRVRAMLARHIFKHCGKNVKIFHGIEFSYGYNLTVEDNCTIHKYVLLDDRGEIIIHEGSLDFGLRQRLFAFARSERRHDRGQSQDGNRSARASDLSCDRAERRRVGEHGIVGSMGVASKRCVSVSHRRWDSSQADQGEIDCTGGTAAGDGKALENIASNCAGQRSVDGRGRLSPQCWNALSPAQNARFA